MHQFVLRAFLKGHGVQEERGIQIDHYFWEEVRSRDNRTGG